MTNFDLYYMNEMNYLGPGYFNYCKRMEQSVYQIQRDGAHVDLDMDGQIWRAFTTRHGLLQGVFWQQAGIMFPYVRSTYSNGKLIGYRVSQQKGSSWVKVEFYQQGILSFRFHCDKTKNCCYSPCQEYILFPSRKSIERNVKCLSCLIISLQNRYRTKKARGILETFLLAPLANLILMYTQPCLQGSRFVYV